MISLCRRVCDVPDVPQSVSLCYALIAMPVFMAWSRCCVADDPFRARLPKVLAWEW